MVLCRCGDCPETETESRDDRELPTLEQVSWWSPRWRNILKKSLHTSSIEFGMFVAHFSFFSWNQSPLSATAFSQFELKNGCHLISSNVSQLPTLELAFFWSAQVIGTWRDDDGAVYTITMDASGDSASASIKRQDGKRFEAKETIKCGEQGRSGDIKTSHGAVSPLEKRLEPWKFERKGAKKKFMNILFDHFNEDSPVCVIEFCFVQFRSSNLLPGFLGVWGSPGFWQLEMTIELLSIQGVIQITGIPTMMHRYA